MHRGKYEEAEPLYLRALRIREQVLGLQHSQLASPLYNLAEIYRKQGRYSEAEPFYLRALSIAKQSFGPEHMEVGYSLNGLAMFYVEQGKYEEAETLYQQTLTYMGTDARVRASTRSLSTHKYWENFIENKGNMSK